jgi:predicted transcriptional regulator
MKVRDLMIPVSDCAHVAEDRTIYDAVIMLEAWRQRSQSEYRPRLVLVYDKDFRIIGSLRQVDVLQALASGRIATAGTGLTEAGPPGVGGSASFEEGTAVWGVVLTHLYEAAHRVRVKDAMYHYHEAEYIEENTSMEEALSRLLSGLYLNLVVTSGNTTVGIVRLSDVFDTVCKEIKRSGMK